MKIQFVNGSEIQSMIPPIEQDACQVIYCENGEDNRCPKKESCKRYLHANEHTSLKLYKLPCTRENNYLLYIKEDYTNEE